jgi:peptidyl-prolyl cis-trans isomerase D
MLSTFRNLAKSPVAIVLIGLLVVSFAVFGINDVFRGRIGDSVVKAGDREISPAQFKRLFDNFREQAAQETGRQIGIEEAAAQGLDRRLLEDIVLSESLAELIRRIGINVSDQLVARQLRQTPIFFNPVSGAFDPEEYKSQLARNELTTAEFEGFLRDDVAQQHWATAVAAGLRVPRIYGAIPAVFEGETRNLSYFIVDPSISGTPNPPTDAELQAFMRENAEALRRPETRTISVVQFSASEIAPTIQVDPAELQRQFEFRRDSLSQPERRTFVQIPAPDRAAAERAAQQLRAGQAPDAVARGLGREPVRYDAQPRTAVTDAAAASVAFGLQAGQVSAPFQGGLGWAVVKLDSILPAQTANLEQVRPQLEQQIRGDQAADRVLEQVQQYEDAVEGGATLAEAAQRVGRTVVSLPPVTAQGTDALGNPTGIPAPLLEQAFELPVGGESEIIDAGRNEYFVVRVDRITPSALPKLEEVRGPLTQAWTLRRTVERAKSRADALAAQMRGANAKTLQTVAQSVNAPVNTAIGVERDAGGQSLSRDLVAKAFGAKRGEVIVGEHTQLGFVVARIDAAAAPAPAEVARAAEDVRPGMTLDVIDGLRELARSYARDAVKARVDPARARQALGLDPAETPADKAK